MGNLKFSLSLLLSILLLGCAKNLPTEIAAGLPVGGNKPAGEKTYLQGSFETTEAANITLNEQIQKPMVLIFSQDTCLICRAETKMLVEKFQAGLPQNVDIYTILVGTILEDALDFKEELKIPWPVGFQSGDVFFKAYCPGLKVPCVIVQTPAEGYVFQKTGEFSVTELEKHTGTWIY